VDTIVTPRPPSLKMPRLDAYADQIETLARWLSTSPLASAVAAPVELQPTTIEAFAREEFAPAHSQLAIGVA
jgi:Neuraminidase (sialidase)